MPIVPKPCHVIQTIAYKCISAVLTFCIFMSSSPIIERVSINILSDEVALNVLLNFIFCTLLYHFFYSEFRQLVELDVNFHNA